MICDEAHRLKNRKALQTQFVRRIKTNHAYMVTGTPMMNRTEELWSLLNILYPKTFTSFWRFVDMYRREEHHLTTARRSCPMTSRPKGFDAKSCSRS